MTLRNKIGIYGAYACGIAGIGFTLPYLPLYLHQRGLSDSAIGGISTLAAASALLQFPLGVWSDRLGRRKPFLVAALVAAAVATWALPHVRGPFGIALAVVFFAENGFARATIESLSGAEVVATAGRDRVGAALGALRLWKPLAIILTALGGGVLAERYGVASILTPLGILQTLAIPFALLIQPSPSDAHHVTSELLLPDAIPPRGGSAPWRDRGLWAFMAAMVLYHAANAPAGVYLGLLLERGMHAPRAAAAHAFVVSMLVWAIVVRPAGKLADRARKRPLLIACWLIMAVRLAIVAIARSPSAIVANQALDGLANGLFAVLAASWVTDRLADPRSAGLAQVIVGTCLVAGSAAGPAIASLLVEPLGYRQLFAILALAGVGAALVVIALVPETTRRGEPALDRAGEPARFAALSAGCDAHRD